MAASNVGFQRIILSIVFLNNNAKYGTVDWMCGSEGKKYELMQFWVNRTVLQNNGDWKIKNGNRVLFFCAKLLKLYTNHSSSHVSTVNVKGSLCSELHSVDATSNISANYWIPDTRNDLQYFCYYGNMAGERRVQIILFFLHLSLSYLDLFSISSATFIVPIHFRPSLFIKWKQVPYTVRPFFYPFGKFHFSLLF